MCARRLDESRAACSGPRSANRPGSRRSPEATVRLKLETLQPTFSYKIRGAFNTILRLIEEHPDQRQPLVTASAGNHGSALARAARFGRFPLIVYASAAAPKVKLDGMREEGADVRLCRDYDEAELTAKQLGTSGDALFISPYAHPDVIAGAGTVGLGDRGRLAGG